MTKIKFYKTIEKEQRENFSLNFLLSEGEKNNLNQILERKSGTKNAWAGTKQISTLLTKFRTE